MSDNQRKACQNRIGSVTCLRCCLVLIPGLAQCRERLQAARRPSDGCTAPCRGAVCRCGPAKLSGLCCGMRGEAASDLASLASEAMEKDKIGEKGVQKRF
eukprot:1491596-Rhodomonas_salina.8